MDKRPRRGGCGIKLFLLALLLVALGPSLVGLTRAAIKCQLWKDPKVTETGAREESIRAATQRFPDYLRAEDQTYLTLPEWYIVYSADEYAAFISKNSPTDFPHFKAVGQYWQSYYDVCDITRGRYPRNGNEQFVLGFIGVSFTAENMIKGVYETIVGRAAEWIGSGVPTEEEIYAAQVANEYGDFLHMTPWYLFPFKEKLRGLWKETSLWGPDPIRKWDRKLALSVEYGMKTLYGGLTRSASAATYGGPDESKIYAVAEGVTDDMAGPDLEIIQPIDKQRQVVYLTRFETFSQIVPPLMKDGLKFVEIAGNDELLVTLIGPQNDAYDFEHGEILFMLPILTQPGTARVGVRVRVPELHLFLEELQGAENIQFEHIYDY